RRGRQRSRHANVDGVAHAARREDDGRRRRRYVTVTPEDVKAGRKDLACTAKGLAGALGVEQATVLAWEKAEAVPRKASVDKMNALRAKGPSAIVRKAK